MQERSVARPSALAAPGGAAWDDDLPRPCRMLWRPEPVEEIALLADNAPRTFTWRTPLRGDPRRRARAAPRQMVAAWSVEGERPYTMRDYYPVETATGGRY